MCNEASEEGDGFVFTVGIGDCAADAHGCSGLVLTEQGNLYVAGKVVQMDSDCLDYAAIRAAESATKKKRSIVEGDEASIWEARLERLERQNLQLQALVENERLRAQRETERWQMQTEQLKTQIKNEQLQRQMETEHLRSQIEAESVRPKTVTERQTQKEEISERLHSQIRERTESRQNQLEKSKFEHSPVYHV
eukprot:TRINITY_DN1630_c0_g1_i3.p1 TRINITY_DN1630_c0_g1~~TRINITY_DN1630_c0_g1_i3.p1  ORF type:complete len:194 (-),score=42.21 TRINITY_DN1630_c0_g1_i3:66-647(-)